MFLQFCLSCVFHPWGLWRTRSLDKAAKVHDQHSFTNTCTKQESQSYIKSGHREKLKNKQNHSKMGIGMLCQKASSLARCGNQAVGAISQNLDLNLEHQTFRTPIFHSWQIFKTST